MADIDGKGIIRQIRPIRVEFAHAPDRRRIEQAVLVLIGTRRTLILLCTRRACDLTMRDAMAASNGHFHLPIKFGLAPLFPSLQVAEILPSNPALASISQLSAKDEMPNGKA